MRDEIVPEGDLYEYPDVYLERLKEYETNGPEYDIVQGALYEWLDADARASAREAMNVSRHLNNGEVEKAEELVEEVLEDDG